MPAPAAQKFRLAGARRAVVEQAFALLERMGIADDAGRLVKELPYGKQRLVEIAIALGLDPSVLLLDEPAAGVPSAENRIILDVIAQLPDISRGADHRTRHGSGVPVRATHHGAGAGRHPAGRHAGRDRRRCRACAKSILASGSTAEAIATDMCHRACVIAHVRCHVVYVSLQAQRSSLRLRVIASDSGAISVACHRERTQEQCSAYVS